MNTFGTKEFYQLSKSAQRRMTETYRQDVLDGINEYLVKTQKNWLMMQSIVNHDYMGMTREDCLLALANWNEVYRQVALIKSEEEQTAFLTSKMDDIFGVGGYPKEYIDKLGEKEW